MNFEVCFADSLYLPCCWKCIYQELKNARIVTAWSIMVKRYESFVIGWYRSSLLLTARGAEIVNFQGCGNSRFFSSYTKYTDTESCNLQSLWKFVEISMKICFLIWLNWRTKIKYFIEIHFSQTLILTGLFCW